MKIILIKNTIPVPTKKNPPKDLMKFTSKDKGTLVIWSDHDKLDDDVIDVIEDFEIWFR